MPDHLILMTRYPRFGHSKSHFIPALGAKGAARLERRLIEHTAHNARAWRSLKHDHRLVVSCDGATVSEYADWLGADLDYESQCGGSRGARMAVASVRAFARGADRVIMAGTDCPDLDEVHLSRAFYGLEHADCVIGPGRNGSYYLIGLAAPTPALFAGIPWGTGAVLARTLAAVHKERLRAGLLPTLPTLAGPGDLIHAAPLMMEQSVSNQTG